MKENIESHLKIKLCFICKISNSKRTDESEKGMSRHQKNPTDQWQ
jgi:hypothetical protein